MEDKMKKTYLLVIAAVLVIFISCGKIKDTSTSPTIPVDPLEGAIGGVDTSTFPFETSSDLTGFTVNGGGFGNIAISSQKAYMGTSSVQVNVNFTSPNEQGRLNKSAVDLTTLLGKSLSGNVWVPNGMFAATTPYGGFFYIQFDASNNNDWYQSTWQNLTAPSGAIKGLWNSVTFNVNDMTLQNGNGAAGHINGKTMSQNSAPLTALVTLGFVVGQGGTSGNYSGNIYIDSINIQ
jgi:hypothetical protein